MRKFMVRTAFVAVLACAAIAVGAAASSQGAAQARTIRVYFIKHVVDRQHYVFRGFVFGGATGLLNSRVVSLDGQSGPVLYITFDWIASAGPKSFTARTSGFWDTSTGRVVMNGSVIAGWHLGAAVHEEGQLVEPKTLTFFGFLDLMPASG